MTDNGKILLGKIQHIPVIDTHEHYAPEQFWNGEQADFFSLLSPYVCDNLQAAGMGVDEWVALQNHALGTAVRLDILKPFLSAMRFTRYFQVVDHVVRGRYGLREYTAEELDRIRPFIQRDFSAENFQNLKQETGIREIMTFLPFDCHLSMGESTMLPVPTVSDIHLKNRWALKRLEEITGSRITSFDRLLEAIDRLFEAYHAAGIRAIKFGSGYRRRLDYKLTSRADAEKCFIDVLRDVPHGDTIMCGACPNGSGEEQLRALDDYLAFYMTAKAGEYAMAVFFHCGIHAWNENDPDATRISGLRELIALNPHVSFTLLHCGYPYIDDALLLAKYYPNVYLNLTWVHILDRIKAIELMRRMVELLPVNKIEGFGGDYCCLALTAEHLCIARENISDALSLYVDKGEMNMEEAVKIARAWLYNNAAEHYNLEVSHE